MPVWEVHVSHKKGGWSIRHVEAPDQEIAEADTLEDVFRFYSPEDRAEGLANSRISRAIPHADWGYLQEHQRLTDLEGNPVRIRRRKRKRLLTNSGNLSYSDTKASSEVNLLTEGVEMTTEAAKAKAEKADKEKADKEAKAKLDAEQKAKTKANEKEKAEKAEEERRKNIVTVADLAEKHGKEPRVIRRILRSSGLSSPRGEDTANRYEWPKNSQELPKIDKLISEYGQKKEEEEKAEKEPAKA